MDFSEALKAMRMGSKVARETWRGQIAYIKILTRKVNSEELIQQFMPDGKNYQVCSLDDDDILAKDWWIVP